MINANVEMETLSDTVKLPNGLDRGLKEKAIQENCMRLKTSCHEDILAEIDRREFLNHNVDVEDVVQIVDDGSDVEANQKDDSSSEEEEDYD